MSNNEAECHIGKYRLAEKISIWHRPKMGEAFDKFADKLPDLYFDWYARLLPGVVAATATIYFLPDLRQPALRHTAELMLCAYIAGHCIQPFSSMFVKGGKRQLRFSSDDD